MKTEELLSLGLNEEQAQKILAMNGKDINQLKAASDAARTELEGLRGQLKAAGETIEGFKKLDVDGIRAEAAKWKERHETDTKALQEKLARQARDGKIDLALLGAKAKNVKAARALLDLEKIKLDGEALTGLDEQLARVSRENPYLFEGGERNPPPPANGGAPVGDELAAWRTEAGLPPETK